jgi:hypothetical protein
VPETNYVAWRQKVYKKFLEKFPNIKISEQRIADQKRAMENRNLLAKDIRDRIKAEVEKMPKEDTTATDCSTKQNQQQTHEIPTYKEEQ